MSISSYLLAAARAVLVTMSLALLRAGLGLTVFDRILAANMFAPTVLFIGFFFLLSVQSSSI